MTQDAVERKDQRGVLAPHPVLHRFYGGAEERQPVVNSLFDESARHYDSITTWMSFGTGTRYRREVLQRNGVGRGSRVLDIACGTGQVAAAASELVGPEGLVLGVDPSRAMREVAEQRRGIRTIAGTSELLPVDSASFDFVTMGYALRHSANLAATFGEMRRVLKPGGRAVVLEITPPEGTVARTLLKAYLKHVVPPLTLVITRSFAAKRLMDYYWESIEQCVRPKAILDAMSGAGFEAPTRHRTLGVLNEYVAVAPACDEAVAAHV
jgi:demethylmenaquinone methyltransferase/2-methoxy-6-polyprenyl-1,4-benzoquinol methylase